MARPACTCAPGSWWRAPTTHQRPTRHTLPRARWLHAAGLGGAGWAYGKMGSPRSAAVAGAFAVLYGFSGRLLSQGHERLGYDVVGEGALPLSCTLWAPQCVHSLRACTDARFVYDVHAYARRAR